METKVCHVIKLGTSFQKKLNCSLLVQDGHGFFRKGGTWCPTLATGDQEKPRLDRANECMLPYNFSA